MKRKTLTIIIVASAIAQSLFPENTALLLYKPALLSWNLIATTYILVDIAMYFRSRKHQATR